MGSKGRPEYLRACLGPLCFAGQHKRTGIIAAHVGSGWGALEKRFYKSQVFACGFVLNCLVEQFEIGFAVLPPHKARCDETAS